MSGLRSYEGDYDHAGKSDFGLLLLRLRRRHDETYRQQGARLGYAAGTLKQGGSKSGHVSGRLRAAVVRCYALTTNEYEAALGRETLGHEGT